MLLASPLATQAGGTGEATYLANAGVMVDSGGHKVLFDPLFRLNHGYYDTLPEWMENDVMLGVAPFDGVTAVFISHYHRDHFSPNLLLNFLMIQPDVRLFAPAQAVSAMERYAGDDEEGLMERVTRVALDTGDEPAHYTVGDIAVEVVRVPHAGWPDSNRDTENLVFRVSLGDGMTVVHYGDAISQPDAFARYDDHWAARRADLSFPPVWFWLERDGVKVLQQTVPGARHIGVHVSTEVPSDPARREAALRAVDLFTEPGEQRRLGGDEKP